MIQVKNLYKRFGKNQVLSGLDLSINGSGIFAVLGPNGSGKTTLIKSILGMVIPDKGDILVQENQIQSKWKYRKDINYLPQIANFPGNLKVRELMAMIMDLRQKSGDIEKLVEQFDLQSYMDKKLSTLSGGTKQKVNIVLAFMFDSQFLILDEPTTGLDPQALIQLKELLRQEKKKGKTILITSHILQFVQEMADEVIYLLEGKIYFKGSITDLRKKTGQDNFEHAIATIASQAHD